MDGERYRFLSFKIPTDQISRLGSKGCNVCKRKESKSFASLFRMGLLSFDDVKKNGDVAGPGSAEERV